MIKPLLQVSDNLGNSFKKHYARYDDIIKPQKSTHASLLLTKRALENMQGRTPIH